MRTSSREENELGGRKACKMAQRVEVLAKPNSLRSIPRTHRMEERADSGKMSSDLHILMHTRAFTLTQHYTRAHTQVNKTEKERGPRKWQRVPYSDRVFTQYATGLKNKRKRSLERNHSKLCWHAYLLST